jgi:glycolate oxidase iron-sulfur subunit
MSSSLTSALASEQDKLLACVHCGLCLEACPTYVATGDENDSPRGRIYLMRAVEEGRLANTSSSFQQHIDRCLGCRACESACPAGVEYGLLLEAARHEILKKPRGFGYWLLRFVLRNVWLKPARLRASFAFARFIRDSGIASFLLRTGILRDTAPRLEFAMDLLEGSQSNAPATDKTPESEVKTSREAETTVMLFKGCVTEGLFSRVNEATARVLEANGTAVRTPDGQVCCGALHAHAGDLEGARKLARQNIDAFGEDDASKNAPIVTNAGGCGAMLASYADVLENDERYAERAREFSARVRDVGQQLEAIGFRNGAAIGFTRTTYDASCHLLHGQHAADASLQMLWAIPDLNFALLKESEVCCGGAGVYNLMEPVLSEEVLTAKLEHIEASRAKVLATGNPGCHMQIAAGARLAGMELAVYHPVELLDESYRRAGFYEAVMSDK